MRPNIAVIMLACSIASAHAADKAVLEGEVIFSREPLTDPLPDGDPVAYVSFYGKDAEKMYAQMKSKDFQNACGLDGVTARTVGNLICYKSKDNDYSCNFGVRLSDGYLVLGKPC
jgi:hypothetical protein